MRPFGGKYANVTATLALVVALSGTSYAAITITGAQIRNGSIKSVDLAKGSVTSVKVADGALRARDFRAGELPSGAPGANGARGPAGAKGDPGAAAAKGDPGIRGEQGAKGDPGPTASTFVSHRPTSATAIAAGGTLVLTTGSGVNRGPLALLFPGRVLVAAALTVTNSSASALEVACSVFMGPAGQPADEISQQIVTTVPGGRSEDLALVAGADRPVGTWAAGVLCFPSGPGLAFEGGDLTMTATAR